MAVRNLLFVSFLLAPLISNAADQEFTLVIKDHKFSPAEVKVPADKKIKLIVDNQDATIEEFDSHDLNREKVIPPKSKGIIYIGPLKPGKYKFEGEFNASTAQGVVIAE
ncbi:MAG: cupredoxin domain-containing protein [Burkholderiaceae bacterium]